jgi:SAM-dependent methyltransferase
VFPENPDLARRLADRSGALTALDPSSNIEHNEVAHRRVQALLEDFRTDERFDLITMRMVVEHVSRPDEFVAALRTLVRPGGKVIVFTVSRWAPVSIVSRLVPFGLHHTIKARIWGGEAEDTFPVHYRMNTRRRLRQLFQQAGFREMAFARLDDLSVFGQFNFMNRVELTVWRVLRGLRIRYPEHCLLGIYRR